jgi:hypothetical protein
MKLQGQSSKLKKNFQPENSKHPPNPLPWSFAMVLLLSFEL